MTREHVVLAGVDRAALAAALAVRLRRAGMTVGLGAIESFTRALDVWPPPSRSSLYWVARISLVRRPSDVEIFDGVYSEVFEGTGLHVDPQARRRFRQAPASAVRPPRGVEAGGWAGDVRALPWATLQIAETAGPAQRPARASPERLPSALEGLADVPFADLDPEQLALLDRWFADALARWPARRSRRSRVDRTGRRIELRATLARARRTGHEPAVLVRSRPVPRRRRVVMLCDVSQSMQPYAAAYLHLMRAAVVAADAEVFAFATSLTRLTPVLAHASPEVAVGRASARVADRFGGTRIATNLAALLASRHGGTTRGAIVVVASDGWDSDPPDSLERAMARLRRRAYRLLWLNPRAAAPGFEPLAGGMAAALPFCDEVLPANTLGALEEVVEALARA